MTDAVQAEGGSAVAGRWDPGLQAQISELNAQVLELVRRRSQLQCNAREAPLFAELAPLWQGLGEDALQALSRCPYLMLDAGFARPEYWDGAVRDASEAGAGYWLGGALEPDLVRRAVMLGWHLARANPFAARMTLGMTPLCAQLIARTRLRDLEALVERRVQSCRLRWEDRPAIWRQLLEAALGESPVALERLQLRGFQLLAAEIAPQA